MLLDASFPVRRKSGQKHSGLPLVSRECHGPDHRWRPSGAVSPLSTIPWQRRHVPAFGVTICAVTNLKVFASTSRVVWIAAAFLFSGVTGSTTVYPQDAQNRVNRNEVELLPVQGNISMLAGAGGNITVQAGKDGVFLVDSGVAPMSDNVLAAIRTLSKGQITYIVNTNDRPDHVGGNEPFARVGRPLAINRAAQASVFIIAFSTILERMSDRNAVPAIPDRAWPNDTYSVPQQNL